MTKALKILILLLICSPAIANAKNDKKFVREGNKAYHNENYEEAELSYRKASEINSENFKADFNLADALYKKEAYNEAAGKLEFLKDKAVEPKTVADISYNLGNSYFMQAQKASESQNPQQLQMSINHLKKAVESYKDALRNNPADNDARHNYELAKRMLQDQQKQQQQQQQNQDQNQDQQNKDQNKQDQDGQNKDQNKDGQNKQDQNQDGQNQENKDKQGQDKQDQNGENKQDQEKQGDEKKEGQGKEGENQEQQGKQQQAKPVKMSKDEAEKMLKALQQKEKGTLKKMKRQNTKKAKIEKNW
jgi:hypothetical protein